MQSKPNEQQQTETDRDRKPGQPAEESGKEPKTNVEEDIGGVQRPPADS
jgi:hypothetical protein